MTDIITDCFVYKNANNSIDRYEILFSIDLTPYLLDPLLIRIIVMASDLSDPTDLNEVKSNSVSQASILKANNLKTLQQVKTEITSLDGPVIL